MRIKCFILLINDCQFVLYKCSENSLKILIFVPIMANPLKQLAGETAIYGLSTILARIINFLFVPFYTRLLTTASYGVDRKSTRLNSSHQLISYAVVCWKKHKKKKQSKQNHTRHHPTTRTANSWRRA